MTRKDNQRGGIVIFAVVGVVLVGLLAGALYVGKQRAEVAKAGAPKPIAIDTEKEATDKSKSTASSTSSNKPTSQSKPASSPAKSSTTQSNPPASSTPTTTTPSTRSVANTGPSQVAATGPVDTLLSLGAIIAISFVAFAFLQSNIRLRQSALNR